MALAGVYFVYSAKVEEHYVTERFPDAYPVYKRSTKMLVPLIFKRARAAWYRPGQPQSARHAGSAGVHIPLMVRPGLECAKLSTRIEITTD